MRCYNGNNYLPTQMMMEVMVYELWLLQIGSWDSRQGINVTKNYSDEMQEMGDILKNKMLIVTTLLVFGIHTFSALISNVYM